MVILLGYSSVHLVLLFELRLNVFEAFSELVPNLFLRGLLKIDLVEKISMLITDEVKDFALGER